MKVAICLTVADAKDNIDFFIRYHFLIGFSHIIVFVDDGCEETYLKATRYSNVLAFKRDCHLLEAWKLVPIYRELNKRALKNHEVMVRQEYNVFVAHSFCHELEIDWLLHIDIDELFYLNGNDFDEFFLKLDHKAHGGCIFTNYEVIPNSLNSELIYLCGDVFKKNYFKRGVWNYSDSQRKYIEKNHFLGSHNLNYYQNGKAASKVEDLLVVRDVHSMCDSKGKMKICGHDDPLILHFPCATYHEYEVKYSRLGNFSDYWNAQPRAGKFIDTFHLESRDAFKNGKSSGKALYEKRILLDLTMREDLIRQDLAVRIHDIIDMHSIHKNYFESESKVESPKTFTASKTPSIQFFNFSKLTSGEYDIQSVINAIPDLFYLDFDTQSAARIWLRRHPYYKDLADCSIRKRGQKWYVFFKNYICVDIDKLMAEMTGSEISQLLPENKDINILVETAPLVSKKSISINGLNREIVKFLTLLFTDRNLFMMLSSDIESHVIPMVLKGESQCFIDLSFLKTCLEIRDNKHVSAFKEYIGSRYPRTNSINWVLYLEDKLLSDGIQEKDFKLYAKNLLIIVSFLGGSVIAGRKWYDFDPHTINFLIEIRSKYPALETVYAQSLFAEDSKLIVLVKSINGQYFLLISNLSDETKLVTHRQLEVHDLDRRWSFEIGTESDYIKASDGIHIKSMRSILMIAST